METADNDKQKQQEPTSNSIPDLCWEEVATNTEQLKQANSAFVTDTDLEEIAFNTYLEEIAVVNDALRRGVPITIRVAGHGFTCPPDERYPILGRSEEGCLLKLQKVVVKFRQEEQTLIYRIALRFWDSTHEQEVSWGANLVQPQWKNIVQQAL